MSRLLADRLREDPRIAQAKRLVLEALADHQRQIDGVRPCDPEREHSYAQTIARFGQVRGGDLYYSYLGSGLGKGALVELADGSVKYDMISGIGVHYLGHAHRAIVAAAMDAAVQDIVMQGNLQQNAQAVVLADKLVELASRNGARLAHCFLSSSGAMANENALKLLFQKHHPADRILAFEGAFAGRTLALAQITDKPGFRQGLPTTLHVDCVPFYDSADPQASTDAAVSALKAHLARYPGRYAAMCMELVLGEGGFYPGERSFFTKLIELLKSNGVGVWIDEIQTFGRTIEPFTFQTLGLDAHVDVVTVGKLLQVCATLFTDAYKPKPGLISQTFTASTSAIFVAQAMLSELLSGGYFGADGRIERIHRRFVGHLQTMAQRHPEWVHGPFGMGAMIAFTPFNGSAQRTKLVLHALFRAGVIAFEAGEEPTRMRFLPPVGAVTDDDIDAVCGILERTLANVAAES